MPLDNPLKGIVDAISENVNEMGGVLLTRTRIVMPWGANDGSLAAANPTRITSRSSIFESYMVGWQIDVLKKAAPTGNEGSYLILTVVNDKNVTVSKIDGAVATFVNESAVRFRFASLPVESTWEFRGNDAQMQIWVGEQATPTPYAAIDQTPGAQWFLGLGAQLRGSDGRVSATAGTSFRTLSEFFNSGMVGDALWILPANPPTGIEGPYRITAFVDSREVTVSGAAPFAADETGIAFVVKTYEDSGYLTQNHRQESEVADGSQGYSSWDQLRRAILIDYATEEELARIGRNYGVRRLRGLSDEAFRRLLKVLCYLPRCTVQGLEIVLDALFPEGGWEIYEDLINFHNQVFIYLPALAGDSEDFEGKAFLAPTGADVTPPLDLATFDPRDGYEYATATGVAGVTAAHSPTTVEDIRVRPVTQQLEMTLLPSADTPAWTFETQGVGVPAEGTVFSVASGALVQVVPGAPSADGGAYYRNVVQIDRGTLIMAAYWRLAAVTTVAGRPWHIGIYDAATGFEYFLAWSDTDCAIVQAGGIVRATATPSVSLGDGNWHLFELKRVLAAGQAPFLVGTVDGEVLFRVVDISGFTASALRRFHFGYFDVGAGVQNWTVEWDRVRIYVEPTRNHWNLSRDDGTMTGADDNLSSAAALFVAGDAGNRIRILNGGNLVRGIWEVGVFVGAGALTLTGLVRGGATIQTVLGSHFVTLEDPLFESFDLGKQIEAAAAGGPEIRTVLEVVSRYQVRVDGVDFIAETGLDWKFNPNNFAVESNLTWELIDTGAIAGAALTVREVFPTAAEPLKLAYTTVLSAQILRDEFVSNDRVSPDRYYYPFYLFDVDNQIRGLIDEVTAAGVIPAFERVWP